MSDYGKRCVALRHYQHTEIHHPVNCDQLSPNLYKYFCSRVESFVCAFLVLLTLNSSLPAEAILRCWLQTSNT